MRNQKTLALSDSAKVTVLELRPVDIKRFLSVLKGNGDVDFEKLVTEDWDDVMTKLSGVIVPDGVALEELSFSEIAEIKTAFMEVNAPFFGLLAGLGLNLAVAGVGSAKTSTAPVSASLSAVMSASSSTVGASS